MAMWGAIAGGVLGLLDDGGGQQTVTNQIPPEFQGLASQVGQYGQGFAGLDYQPYPYSQVADFNPYQYMGFDMGANYAMGNQLPQEAQNALNQTMGGGYLGYSPGTNPYMGQNPYLDTVIGNTLNDVTKQFNTQVAPSMAATAMKSGSFGNTGFQEAENDARDQLASRLGSISSGMRMQDYGASQNLYENQLNRTQGAFDSERNRMMGALGQAGNIYNLGYQPANYLQGIGATMQQQGQNVLNSQYQQYQDAQNYPFKIWDAMRAPFGGVNTGGTQTSNTSSSPVSGMLGGAMLGAKMGQNFGGMFGGNSNWANTWGGTQNPFGGWQP